MVCTLPHAHNEDIAAGTVNWVSQASFQPPLIMAAVKADSHLHALIDASRHFALSVLGADQQSVAQDFFRKSQRDGQSLNGLPSKPVRKQAHHFLQSFRHGSNAV